MSGRTVAVELTPRQYALLERLPRIIGDALTDTERRARVAARLFPATYGDPEAEEEHWRLVGDILVERRRENLDAFATSLQASRGPDGRYLFRLSEGEADLWLHVINDARVLLGTELDIRDNGWAERGPERAEDAAAFADLVALSDLEDVILSQLLD